jgi:hypothetical protein
LPFFVAPDSALTVDCLNWRNAQELALTPEPAKSTNGIFPFRSTAGAPTLEGGGMYHFGGMGTSAPIYAKEVFP